MRTHHYPSDVTDEQWAPIVPFIPMYAGGRPRETDVRDALHAILYVLRTAASGDTCPRTSRPGAPSGGSSTSSGPTTLDRIHDALGQKVRTKEKPYQQRASASVDIQSAKVLSR